LDASRQRNVLMRRTDLTKFVTKDSRDEVNPPGKRGGLHPVRVTMRSIRGGADSWAERLKVWGVGGVSLGLLWGAKEGG